MSLKRHSYRMMADQGAMRRSAGRERMAPVVSPGVRVHVTHHHLALAVAGVTGFFWTSMLTLSYHRTLVATHALAGRLEPDW